MPRMDRGALLADMGGMFDYTQKDYWGGPWYPYWSLILITVLGGFIGLDHFFLRSPVTAMAKLVVNIFGFGIWYLYDILQIVADKKSVMEHGLSAPFWGGTGIARGMFRDGAPNQPLSKSPVRYLLFAIVSLIQPFGVESYIAGDSSAAFFRIAVFLLLFFLWPLLPFTLLWTLWNGIQAWFLPRRLFEKPSQRFWPFSYKFMLGPEGPNKMAPKDLGVQPPSESGQKGIFGLLLLPFTFFFKWLGGLLGFIPGVGPAVVATGAAVEATAGAVEAGATTAKAGFETATEVVKEAGEQIPKVMEAAGDVAAMGASSLGGLPGAGKEASAALRETVKQIGGAAGGNPLDLDFDMSLASPALSLSILVLVSLGGYLAFSRLYTYHKKSRDDNSDNNQDPRKRNDIPPKP